MLKRMMNSKNAEKIIVRTLWDRWNGAGQVLGGTERWVRRAVGRFPNWKLKHLLTVRRLLHSKLQAASSERKHKQAACVPEVQHFACNNCCYLLTATVCAQCTHTCIWFTEHHCRRSVLYGTTAVVLQNGFASIEQNRRDFLKAATRRLIRFSAN